MDRYELDRGAWAKSTGIPVKTASLVIALSRAMMLRREWSRAVMDFPATDADNKVGQAAPFAEVFVWWNWACLWLGCLEVVVEGFEEGYKHDARLIDQRISDQLSSPFRQMLKRLRNKTFHPEPFNDAKVLEVLRWHREFIPWAERLTDELDEFFQRYLRSSA
jgi:hypothetical protein